MDSLFIKLFVPQTQTSALQPHMTG